MKKFVLGLLILAFSAISASAMQQSAEPSKFPLFWGQSAGTNYIRNIPVPSQIGVVNCAASLTDGFPPLTFIPATAGGCPPFGQDMNGILRQITQWSQWQNAGATVGYDSAFSASIGGYPKGAILQQASNANCWWTSSVDNNTSDPDTGGANWLGYCAQPAINVFVSTAASTGSANAQVVSTTSPSNFNLTAGNTLRFKAGFTNTGPLQVNAVGTGLVNVYRQSQLGATMSVGGEIIAGQQITLIYDGAEYQCTSCGQALIGEVKTYVTGTGTLPPGWLAIDGSCQSTTTYADLYSVVGANWGGGGCPGGQFRLPDGRGQLLVGQDSQGSNGNASRLSSCGNDTTIGARCGSQSQTIAQANLPNVNFSVTVSGSNGSVNIPAGQGIHNHSISPVPGSYVTASGPPYNASFVNGAGTNIFLTASAPTITDSNTLPNMSGSFSGSGTAASGGSGTPFTSVQPVQFATTMVKY